MTVLRTSSCVIALNTMVAALTMTAQAADTILTLACQGTTTITTEEDAKPEPISMGIIINFATRMVQGFGGDPSLGEYPVTITGMNDVTVAFGGFQNNPTSELSITGSIIA
jgi:hypothetical protein